MKIVTIRDFRTRPRQVQQSLARQGDAVLTSNGKPVALMVSVDSGSLDETLETLRRARALQALRAMRREARRRGTDKMSMQEIDAIIARTRRRRRSGRAWSPVISDIIPL